MIERHGWVAPDPQVARRTARRMELIPPVSRVSWRDASRLVPSRYPSVGLFDRVATPEDLELVLELETWTNDRVNTELGQLHAVPRDEWVTGRPMASVVMAAFCHPNPGGQPLRRPRRGACGTPGATAGDRHRRVRLSSRTRASRDRGHRRASRDAAVSGRLPDDLPRSPRARGVRAVSGSRLLRVVAGARPRSPAHWRVQRNCLSERPTSRGECVACFRPSLVTNVACRALRLSVGRRAGTRVTRLQGTIESCDHWPHRTDTRWNVEHIAQVKDVKPHSRGCEECLKMGGRWVHLRLCRSCGHVGCCDSSPNRHATKHFHATKPPDRLVVRAGRGLVVVLRRRNRGGGVRLSGGPGGS